MSSETPVGRELDALVAEKIFGFEWKRAGRSGKYLYTPNGVPAAVRHRKGDAIDSIGYGEFGRLPPYSTDIAAAWEVVEKCGLSVVRSEDGWYAMKPEDILHESLRGTAFPTITLIGREMDYPEPQETAPLAICIEALKISQRPTPETLVVDTDKNTAGGF